MAAPTSLLLLLLLLLAPPDSSAAPVAGLIPELKFFEKSISAIEEVAGYYLEEKKEEGVKDVSGEQSSADDRQLGSSAADSYGALIFDLPVGTSPPQVLPFVMDITTDLVWAQCGKPGPTYAPTFRPNRSDSFSPIGCADPACSRLMPKYKCAGPSDRCGGTSAFLATDTFTFGTTPAKGMVFGCIGKVPERNLNSTFGSAGFSRGPLSLVSQLHISRFSYFIDDGGGDNSFVSFSVADDAAPAKDKGSRSTPLLKGKYPDLYYVKLTGVQVDGELLKDIPEETFSGSGGVILSTTLPLTYLEQAAFKVLRQKLLTRILQQKVVGVPKSPDEDRLCFPTKEFAAVKVPTVALVFDGADAAMELNVKNYFFDVAGSGQTCLTIRPSTGGSVLGSLLQTGRNMTYDIHDDGGVLTFGPAVAASGPAAAATKGGAPALAQASLVTIATLLLLGWVLIF
ncbi:aspartic proteinase nepenthesin-1-like [Triticum dicoccoides]|uniref:aspartic proteinase nepenthesin-1-like n=1 Tax=Triticum dicoccoides TaxID=85692 RepID=UPI00188E2947|nr:aspartic proteinase nepenthesin-1-like [Triticum dicoccoides]